MGRFKYFADIVTFMTGLGIVFFGSFYLVKKYTNLLDKPLLDEKTLERAGGVHDLLKHQNMNMFSSLLLLSFRLLCFAWFALFNTIYKMIFLYPRGWHYFTNWNIYLIGFYFFFSSASSMFFLKKERTFLTDKETTFSYYIAAVASVLYTVAGSAALMVTVLNFLLLNHDLTFWNISLHVSTTIALIADMTLNDMIVNPQDVLFSVFWPFCYVVFIWSIVREGVRGEWPYFFIETQSASCFFWYPFLFVMAVAFFVLFYCLHRGKSALILRQLRRVLDQHEHEAVPISDSDPHERDPFDSIEMDLP